MSLLLFIILVFCWSHRILCSYIVSATAILINVHYNVLKFFTEISFAISRAPLSTRSLQTQYPIYRRQPLHSDRLIVERIPKEASIPPSSEQRTVWRLLPRRPHGQQELAHLRMLHTSCRTKIVADWVNSTFMDPSSTLFCVSTTITPSKETGCACPDGNIYERLSGGSSPCGDYIGGQSDLLEAIFLSCPAIDGGPSGVTSTASTIASSPTTGSTNCPIGEIPDGQAQDTCINTGTGTSPITGTGTGTSIATASGCTGTDQTDMTLTIVQPSLCKASDVQFSTKTAVPTGQLQISSDQTAGWGAVGSIWNFTLDDGATFSSLTAPCQGSTCTNLAGTTDIENAGTITKNSDGVW